MSSSHQTVRSMLDDGSLWVRLNNGRYWSMRPNGKTQLWKRDAFRYRIPFKAGLYVYGSITNADEIGTFDSDAAIIASSTNPNTCPHRAAIKRAA